MFWWYTHQNLYLSLWSIIIWQEESETAPHCSQSKVYPALDLPIGESEWTQGQRHWELQRSSKTNVSSGRDIQTVTKQQEFRLLTLALESWSQQKAMQEFSVTKHNGEKPQEGKGYFSWSDTFKESRPVTRTALCRFFAPVSRSHKWVKIIPVNQLSSSFIIFSPLTIQTMPHFSKLVWNLQHNRSILKS